MNHTADVVIIGGGPAGYVGAIRAAQLGMRVVCIEKRGALGGTCLNEGCIPSKALLASSEHYDQAQHHFALHGVLCQDIKCDVDVMMQRKSKVVLDLGKGIEGLFKKHHITYLLGSGRIEAPGRVSVASEDGKPSTVEAKHIVIATGSEVMPLPGVTVDEKQIVSSKGALSLRSVPKRLLVIGGGYIGLEMGSVWRRLGSEVTVVEFADRIVPAMDIEIGKQFQRILEKQGIEFRLSSKVTAASVKGKQVKVTLEPASGGASESASYDVVLLAIGRRPYTAKLGLETVGITCDARGRIPVNERLETSVPGIYAIGDVIHGPMLAHKAEEDAVALMEMLAGQAAPHLRYDLVPGVVYTSPEVAMVGSTEEQLKADGVRYQVGKFPFLANSRARAAGDTEGMVKILAHAETDAILGVHIIGAQAGEMIAQAVTLMEFGASSEDLARICHSHPSLSEAMKEAALAVLGRPIHI